LGNGPHRQIRTRTASVQLGARQRPGFLDRVRGGLTREFSGSLEWR
jgi:hypothetical protein